MIDFLESLGISALFVLGYWLGRASKWLFKGKVTSSDKHWHVAIIVLIGTLGSLGVMAIMWATKLFVEWMK